MKIRADKLGLLLAAFFLLGGIALIALPQDMMVSHAGNSKTPRYGSDHVTHSSSRFYGGICVLLAWACLLPPFTCPNDIAKVAGTPNNSFKPSPLRGLGKGR